MEDQYIRKRVFAIHDEASDVIEEASEKVTVPDLGEDDPFGEVEPESVDQAEPDEAITSSFHEDAPEGFGEDLDYTKQTGINLENVDASDTAGHEFAENAMSASERLQKINELNEKMKDIGSNRRFVHTASDAPKNAYVYDVKGVPYYFETGDKIRPSDVTEINKDESWWLYDDNDRVLKSILALVEKYPEAIDMFEKVEQAYTFTDRVLKTEDEVVNDEDVFTLKQQDAIVATIIQTKPGAG